jgi:two-component system response regulator VicR
MVMTLTKTPTIKKEHQRILVMDNNQDMMTLLNRSLQLEGFDAIVIGDYDEALERFEQLKPDMVIMDTYNLDDASLHALDTMRRVSDVPIVITTSDSEVATLKAMLAHGADDLVRKPFAVRPFIARIRAKLRRYNHSVIQPSN